MTKETVLLILFNSWVTNLLPRLRMASLGIPVFCFWLITMTVTITWMLRKTLWQIVFKERSLAICIAMRKVKSRTKGTFERFPEPQMQCFVIQNAAEVGKVISAWVWLDAMVLMSVCNGAVSAILGCHDWGCHGHVCYVTVDLFWLGAIFKVIPSWQHISHLWKRNSSSQLPLHGIC